MPAKHDRTAKKDIAELTDGWEIFERSDGELGAVLPYFAPEHLRTFSEWGEEDSNICEYLTRQATNALWKLPGEPADIPDPNLFDDVVSFLRDHIYLLNDDEYSAIASWVICTWIKEQLRIAPRPIFYGTTQSGKTRAINTLVSLSYRGVMATIPTPAVMYSIIESHDVTLFVDEYQSINPDKVSDIEAIFKSGFEKGGVVPRMNPNTMEPVIYRIYGFMCLGTKGKLPPEDVVNRALIINMQQKPQSSTILRRIDVKRAHDLRARLLAFRLRSMNGEIPFDDYLQEASAIAMGAVEQSGKKIHLGDRAIDIAETLLVPALIFKKDTGIMKLIAKCQAESTDELLYTMEARTFYALQACFTDCPLLTTKDLDGVQSRDINGLTTIAVAEQLNLDLFELEGRDTAYHKSRIETHRVASWLKTLGFTIKRGTGNRSYVIWNNFVRTYRTNLDKYGVRDGCADLR